VAVSEAAEVSGTLAHVRAIDPQNSVAVFSQVASNVSAPIFSFFVSFMIHLTRLNWIVSHLMRKPKKPYVQATMIFMLVSILK
jgi:hypothetical protein